MYELINKATRKLQQIIIALFILLYFFGSYQSIFIDKSFISFYLIFTSFSYYLIVITKSPGSLLDLENAAVKGICSKCSRVRGYKTKHCNICNKCYNRRDHHCLLLGKCIAANNLKDFFYLLLFTQIYLIFLFFKKDIKFISFIFSLANLALLSWMGMAIGKDMTTEELMDSSNKNFEKIHLSNLLKFISDSPLKILFPIFYQSYCSVEVVG